MFTGIITDVGRIKEHLIGGDPRFVVETAYALDSLSLGASIAHSGVCLTIIDRGQAEPGAPAWYMVQASAETLGLTTAQDWRVGTRLNLERAAKVGDELGGHIVSGHVDGVGAIIGLTPENESLRVVIEAPSDLAAFIARKGSITVDGVSLTVNEVDGRRFGVNLIPHTRTVTTFDALAVGQRVNLEIDMLARYVARLVEQGRA